MSITIETEVSSGIDTPSREYCPDCVTVSANDYHVVVRGSDVIIETSATTGWQPIVRSVPFGQASGGDDNDETYVSALSGKLVRTYQPDDDTAVLEFAATHGPHHIVTRMIITSDVPHIRIIAVDGIRGAASVRRFGVAWEFVSGPKDGSRPDFIFTPCLAPEPGQIIGQHMFRSPAAIVQHHEVAFALVPDINEIRAYQPLGAYLDIQPPGPGRTTVLSTGVAAYHVDGHVYFTTADVEPVTLTDTQLRFGCELHLETVAPPSRAHQAIVRYHWKRHGRKWLDRDVLPQTVPFKRYFDYGYGFAESDLWRETNVGGKTLGAMVIGREYKRDVWFQGWFNQLRTAYGYYLWARRLGDDERFARARATRDLVLSAPQVEDGVSAGMFPTIAIMPEADGEPVRWVESTLQGGGPGLFHPLDMSWTATWLIRWHAELEPSEETIAFCRKYADALLRLQANDGSWPDYVDRDGRPLTVFNGPDVISQCDSGYIKHMHRDGWDTNRLASSAESAANVLFLAEFSRNVEDGDRYREAALAGATFLEQKVIPEHRWFDWETFFSCSPKSIGFYDERTMQHPQNTMSMFFAAEAFRVLYEITGTATIGEQAVSLMDYVCLYQQVWSPPFITFYGFGGFGAMNTDGEWNDARQAVFADGLARHYLESGRQEYLERAVAATRASFTCTFIPENARVAPKIFDRTPTGHADENYAHMGIDVPAGATGFDWGTGSGLTSAALLLERFGDLWIDVMEGWALGIDALTVNDCECGAGTWKLSVNAPFSHTDTITLKGSPCEYESGVRLVINDLEPITVTDEDLVRGIQVRIR